MLQQENLSQLHLMRQPLPRCHLLATLGLVIFTIYLHATMIMNE
jgi:hypothetical protein